MIERIRHQSQIAWVQILALLLPIVCPWTRFPAALCLSFFTWQVKVIKLPTSWAFDDSCIREYMWSVSDRTRHIVHCWLSAYYFKVRFCFRLEIKRGNRHESHLTCCSVTNKLTGSPHPYVIKSCFFPRGQKRISEQHGAYLRLDTCSSLFTGLIVVILKTVALRVEKGYLEFRALCKAGRIEE